MRQKPQAQLNDFNVVDDAFDQIDKQSFEMIGYPGLGTDLNVSIQDYRSYY